MSLLDTKVRSKQIGRAGVIVWCLVLLLAALAFVLGVTGWLAHFTAQGIPVAWPETFLEASARTVSLFFAETPRDPVAPDNYALQLARILAPLTTLTSLAQVAFSVVARRLLAFRLKRWSGHTVVCGATPEALAFARSETRHGRRTILVGGILSGEVETEAELHGFTIVRGNPTETDVLEAVAVIRASRLIVCMAEDRAALETAMQAKRLAEGARRNGPPLFANVQIRNRQLWQQLRRAPAIEQRSGKFEILPFNFGLWAAREFVWSEPLFLYAAWRGQPRVHAVVVGFDEYAEGLVATLPPSCAFPGLSDMRFTFLTARRTECENRLRQAFPEIDDAAALKFREFDHARDALDETLMAEVESDSPVTAVFVCLAAEDAALGTATYLQDAMRRFARWGAPVYVRLPQSDGLRDLLTESARARRFPEVLHAFGVDDRLCDVELLEGRLETIAQRIHDAYQGTRLASMETETAADRTKSLSDWRELDETYRAANRRAADHIPAKLAAAGCTLPAGPDLRAPASLRIVDGTGPLERLAELEHRSWCLGRSIDGWREGAVRDNRRRLHPDIVPYGALGDATKQYDRDQVRLLDDAQAGLVKRSEDTGTALPIRAEVHVGLIGKNEITADEAAWVRSTLREKVLPALAARHPDACFTLLTPLAPGSDLIQLRTALEFFARSKTPHRVLIVEGVPEQAMVDDYRATFEAGGSWDGEPAEPGIPWTDGDPKKPCVRSRILAERERIVESAATLWAIDLSEPATDYARPEIRQAGYRRAAAAIAERATVLLATVRRSDREGEGPAGGTAETLAARRAALAASDPAARYPRGTILLDLDERQVSEETEAAR